MLLYNCLNVIQDIQATNRKYSINDLQANLLNYICSKYLQKEECRVMEVIYLSEIGSPATLHKNLKVLVNLQLVLIHPDKKDFRVKIVIPSKTALDRLKDLESFLYKK
jgi:hypothetical protein